MIAAVAKRHAGDVAGAATTLIGLLGVGVGVAAVAGGPVSVRLDWLLPLGGFVLQGDALGGVFVLLVGAVAAVVGAYTASYHREHPLPLGSLITLPLFVAAMLLVPLAGSVTTFLMAWEAMALASLVLVLTDHRRAQARSAALIYAVMSHIGFGGILLGLVVFAGAAGSESFAALAAHAAEMPGPVRAAVFLLTFAGFGSKAGLLPLHAWLPRAHPEAPSPVSALMSAAMVNLGIYGLIRVDVTLLGPGPEWWALLLVAVGGVTAVYSVLHASVSTDLKRLLAYSTGENMGLITVAIGASMLLAGSGNHGVAQIAMTAALLHIAAHAMFKALGFLAAGAVQSATGLRDLDSLGGLIRRMPITTVLFGIAAMGATGLPLGAGFVSEWLLLQSLIHTHPSGGATLPLVMPLALGAVALSVGIGIAAMVKAFGVGFLARPRSAEAAAAHEVPTGMWAAMAVPAVGCAVLAVAPGVLAPALTRALAQMPQAEAVERPSLGLLMRLPGIAGSVSPALLAAAVAAGVVVTLAILRARAARQPATVSAPLWACGLESLSPRMQYTATSYAEPLQRVFTGVLRPDADVTVSHHTAVRHVLRRQVTYRSRVIDSVEARLHPPVLRAIEGLARLVRRAHTGSVHLYVAYGAVGLVTALVLAR